jgi:RNA polymerase sigma-70 factor (sigma-E family)
VRDDFSDYMSARWPKVVRAAVLLGCEAHEAEDLAQATFTRAYVKWSHVIKADNRDAYVSRMMLNLFRSSRRRRSGRERLDAEVPELDAVPSPEDARVDSDAVRRALSQLSQPHREVLVLRYYLQLPERDIARTLGVASGTVKSRLSRALAALAADPHITDFVDRSSP